MTFEGKARAESMSSAARGDLPPLSDHASFVFLPIRILQRKTLAEAASVLVSLTCGPDLTMKDVHRVMEQINNKCGDAQVVMGAAIDAALFTRPLSFAALQPGVRFAKESTENGVHNLLESWAEKI